MLFSGLLANPLALRLAGRRGIPGPPPERVSQPIFPIFALRRKGCRIFPTASQRPQTRPIWASQGPSRAFGAHGHPGPFKKACQPLFGFRERALKDLPEPLRVPKRRLPFSAFALRRFKSFRTCQPFRNNSIQARPKTFQASGLSNCKARGLTNFGGMRQHNASLRDQKCGMLLALHASQLTWSTVVTSAACGGTLPTPPCEA